MYLGLVWKSGYLKLFVVIWVILLYHLVDYDSLLELNAKAAEEMRAKEEEEDEHLVQ